MHRARSNLDVIAPRKIYETVLEDRNRMTIRVPFLITTNIPSCLKPCVCAYAFNCVLKGQYIKFIQTEVWHQIMT